MAKEFTDQATKDELSYLRFAFARMASKRATGRAEAIRKFEEDLEFDRRAVRFATAELIEKGVRPSQLSRETGMSIQTIANYMRWVRDEEDSIEQLRAQLKGSE